MPDTCSYLKKHVTATCVGSSVVVGAGAISDFTRSDECMLRLVSTIAANVVAALINLWNTVVSTIELCRGPAKISSRIGSLNTLLRRVSTGLLLFLLSPDIKFPSKEPGQGRSSPSDGVGSKV